MQGRVGFVRVVNGRMDYSLIAAYLPVRKQADKYQSITNKIVQFCHVVLPQCVCVGSVPLLFCVLNDHLGLQQTAEKQWVQSDTQGEAVGSVQKEKRDTAPRF